MANLGALVMIATLAAGQTENPSEHLKVLQPLIGQWVCVGQAQNDSEVIGPKGTEFIAVATYTWAINKNALQIRWVAKSSDHKPVQFVELIGWDGKQKKLVSQGFGSAGNVEHNVWSCSGKTVICDTKGMDAEGNDITQKYLHTFGKDAMTMQVVSLGDDGQEQTEEYKYRRVK